MKAQHKKRILIIAGVIALIIIGAGYYVAYYYKSIIKRTIPVVVAEATDSMYHMSVTSVGINLLNRRIVLKGVRMWPDSARMAMKKANGTAAHNYFEVVIPRLKVTGLMWDKLIGGEGYSCRDFLVFNPSVKIFRSDSLESIHSAATRPPNRAFTVGNLQLVSANVQYVLSKGTDSSEIYAYGCNVKMRDWDLSKESIVDTKRFLLADYGSIDVDSLTYIKPSFLYRFKIEGIHYDNENNKLVATDLRLRLRVPPAEYNKSIGRQIDIFHLHFPTIEVSGIDYNRLFAKRELCADDIYLTQSYVSVYMDRTQPENTKSKMGNFPNQLLQRLALPVYIKHVKVKEGKVIYSETSAKTAEKGSLFFTGINGNIKNMTNMPEYLATDSVAIVTLNGKFNGNSTMQGTLSFALTDKRGGFSANVKMVELYGRQINKAAHALAKVETKSFHMNSMHVSVVGNEHGASGDFEMLYNNLAIKIMKNDGEEVTKQEKKKGLFTFLANNLILYSANPMPGKEVRRVHTKVQRDPHKSFFNLIWKNILLGVRETTIRDLEVVSWIQNNEQQKEQKETRPLKEIFKRKKKKDKKEDK